MKARMEDCGSSQPLRSSTGSSSPNPTTEKCAFATAKHSTPSIMQNSVVVATVSPNNSSMSRMISDSELHPQQSPVSSNPVEFFLSLARSFSDKNLFPKALEYYSRALRIVNKAAGRSEQERMRMADILFEIGGIHLKLNDPLKALIVYDLCQSILRQQLAWDDERNANVLQQQAHIYSSLGDSESAVRVLEELLGIMCCRKADNRTLRETWLELGRHQDILGMHAEASSSRDEASQL